MKRIRSVIFSAFTMALLSWFVPALGLAQSSANVMVIDATNLRPADPIPLSGMGGKSPAGHEIAVNNQYLTFDGKPWLPVMGEFHYSRYPEQYWEEELLKMKAGGVQIVSTYVFWIHHEEVEGQFDWSGQRNLRRFIALCRTHGLYVFLRVGPYAHGEVRNGGLPDWVVAGGATRKNDPQYLARVRRYLAQVGQQVNGLFWKDGGPIIGVQIENEYSQRGPDAGAAHISELKKIARDAGLVAPIYTVTGWDNAVYPPDEFVPVFGGYVDNFWESTLDDLPPAGYYLFETPRSVSGRGAGPESSPYPLLMAEAGGGMEVAYHRRPVISGDDVAAMTLTRLASGVNLYGYYMFQGGANPDGKLTSLQESVETDHVYDLPQVSYDFQAPLGQFGEMNPPFRSTKLFHLFLNEFGSYLAPMTPVLPQVVPANPDDRSTVRMAARIQGARGFVFVNNYQRLYPLPDHPAVQVRLALPAETLLVPRRSVDIPSGAYFIWPVNLDLNGALLKYATAQLLTKIRARDADYYFFFMQSGVAAEFAFDEATISSIHAEKAAISHTQGRIYVDKIAPGRRVAFHLQSKSGKRSNIILLTRTDAENAWKLPIAGREHIVLSPADTFFDEGSLYLRSRDLEKLHFSIFPRLSGTPKASAPLKQNEADGFFAAYSAAIQRKKIDIQWQQIRETAPAAPARMGQYNAIAPNAADFSHAGLWRITVPENAMAGLSDIFLQIHYTGDVARLYSDHRLLDDDFYKGTLWEIGLKRFLPLASHQPLELKVLPLRKDAPIYIPRDSRPVFPPAGEIANVSSITVRPEYEVRVPLQ